MYTWTLKVYRTQPVGLHPFPQAYGDHGGLLVVDNAIACGAVASRPGQKAANGATLRATLKTYRNNLPRAISGGSKLGKFPLQYSVGISGTY